MPATDELDAVLIRSLPELSEASLALDALNMRFGEAFNAEVMEWAARNDWCGESDWTGDTWLAPRAWMATDDPNGAAHLYFDLLYASGEGDNPWDLGSIVGASEPRQGFCLSFNIVRKPVFTRLWREFQGSASLPLDGSDFFLPITLDREALAAAAAAGALADGLGGLRDVLDRLPEIASQLEALKRELVAAVTATG